MADSPLSAVATPMPQPRTGCRICEGRSLREFLNLGLQPWCNDFVAAEEIGQERRYPLHLYFCEDCTAIQVGHTIPKEVMFSQHTYLSGTTRTMRAHFAGIAAKAEQIVRSEGRTLRGSLTVDIGSNDGTLLAAFGATGTTLLGVEPCEQAARIAIQNGLPTLQRFFDENTAVTIKREYGEAQIVSAANVFYHVEDLHSITRGIRDLLAPDGIFIMQGSYLPRIIEKHAFDIMYHEHLLYYRLQTLERLLSMYDMEVFDVDEHPVHGGSVAVYVGHRGRRTVNPKVRSMIAQEVSAGYDRFELYERFSRETEQLRDRIVGLVREKLAQGYRILCYGAPAKGTVMLNYCGFTSADMACAVERNPLKVGRFIPGTGIRIISEADAPEPDYYFLLAWNFLEEFMGSPEFTSGKRRFIVPLPEPVTLP